eukprot:8525330-Alexandrium_andersonii.AAC.1
MSSRSASLTPRLRREPSIGQPRRKEALPNGAPLPPPARMAAPRLHEERPLHPAMGAQPEWHGLASRTLPTSRPPPSLSTGWPGSRSPVGLNRYAASRERPRRRRSVTV